MNLLIKVRRGVKIVFTITAVGLTLLAGEYGSTLVVGGNLLVLSGCLDDPCDPGCSVNGRCSGSCVSGAHCSSTNTGNCSAANSDGIRCCWDAGGGGGGGGGNPCSSGYCSTNGVCCPSSARWYTYGGHGKAAGCYSSCPYVGDCGSTSTCY